MEVNSRSHQQRKKHYEAICALCMQRSCIWYTFQLALLTTLANRSLEIGSLRSFESSRSDNALRACLPNLDVHCSTFLWKIQCSVAIYCWHATTAGQINFITVKFLFACKNLVHLSPFERTSEIPIEKSFYISMISVSRLVSNCNELCEFIVSSPRGSKGWIWSISEHITGWCD